jgi:hypothetical protein
MTTYLIKIDTGILGLDDENREGKGFLVGRRAVEH